MLIYEISPIARAFARAARRFKKIDSSDHGGSMYWHYRNNSHPEWVKQLTLKDQRYRERIIAELEDEGIWDKTVNLTDSAGNLRPLTITLVQRPGDVLGLSFLIDHNFNKPKYKNRVQDTKLAISSMKLVLKETARILHTLRPQQLKFSAVLKDREGRTYSQGESRARLYDSIVSKATPYLKQVGYSVDINQKKDITTPKMKKIEWLLTRTGK